MLYRVVILKKMRKQLGIAANAALTIELKGKTIVITKSKNAYLVCGAKLPDDFKYNMIVCEKCRSEIIAEATPENNH